jgi:hypothetical protein
MLRLAILGLLLAPGCGGKAVDDDDDDEGGTIWVDGPDEADPDAPVIQDADAWCYYHDTGDPRYIWVALLEVSDPQGTETIDPFFTGVTVYDSSGEEMFTESLTCGNGECTGTWREDSYSPAIMTCTSAGDFMLEFVIYDEEGNPSTPLTVTGREGSSASG